MKVGGRYNWKNQRERLVYLGKAGFWHQFAKVGTTAVWCEVPDSDLNRLEETGFLEVGAKYKEKNSPDQLVYIGETGVWGNFHQFGSVETPDVVCCEIEERELNRLEKIV